MSDNHCRCAWVTEDPKYIAYHDSEWGVPNFDDPHLFEMLILEGAQAGLSWLTVLRKREGYRAAFANFDVQAVAAFDEAKQEVLRSNPEIIRNRLKIKSAVQNAQAFLQVQAEFGSFAQFLWGYVDGKPIQNAWKTLADVPAQTPLAERISKDLRKRGFNFVGPTIVYAYMQSVGMVNDHTVDCWRYESVKALGTAL